jgi:hypothetical protein
MTENISFSKHRCSLKSVTSFYVYVGVEPFFEEEVKLNI